jgi:hypothetical protein
MSREQDRELLEGAARAAFEAHFSKPPYQWGFGRFAEYGAWPGHYRNYAVQCAWEAWQGWQR